ncbi:putative Ig domain-containing protein [Alphaproteobacteria bacterium]|nr:putative Ig domain-containing protein [Alphaproteobacteria bacterium]
MTHIKFYSMAFAFIMLNACAKEGDLGSLETSQTAALPTITQNVKNTGKLVAREDQPFNLKLEVTDADIPYGDRINFSMVSLPDWLAVSIDGILSGTPKNADVGSFDIVVRATDRSGKTDDANLNITVVNANDPPFFITTDLPSASEDTEYEIQLEVGDIDLPYGDKLIFDEITMPEWLSLSKDGRLTGLPTNANVGMHLIGVEVVDKAGVAIQREFKVTVENVNDAPVFRFNKKR